MDEVWTKVREVKCVLHTLDGLWDCTVFGASGNRPKASVQVGSFSFKDQNIGAAFSFKPGFDHFSKPHLWVQFTETTDAGGYRGVGRCWVRRDPRPRFDALECDRYGSE